jgi:hypothetical protein
MRIRLVSGSLSGPQKRFFSTALDDYEPVNFCLAIAMMPLQQKLRDSRPCIRAKTRILSLLQSR